MTKISTFGTQMTKSSLAQVQPRRSSEPWESIGRVKGEPGRPRESFGEVKGDLMT